MTSCKTVTISLSTRDPTSSAFFVRFRMRCPPFEDRKGAREGVLQCEEGGRRLSVVAAAGPPLFPHPLLYRDSVFAADDLDPGVDPQLVDDLVEDVPGLDDPLVLVPRGEDEVPVGKAEELVDRRVVQCREFLERLQIRLRPSLFPVRIGRRGHVEIVCDVFLPHPLVFSVLGKQVSLLFHLQQFYCFSETSLEKKKKALI